MTTTSHPSIGTDAGRPIGPNDERVNVARGEGTEQAKTIAAHARLQAAQAAKAAAALKVDLEEHPDPSPLLNAALTPPPHQKRWVAERIESLDPNTQYDEIMQLVANYTLDFLPMNLTLLVATAGATLPAHGSATLIGTQKMLHKSERRFDEGNEYFFAWFFNGSGSKKAQIAIEKLNQHHMGIAQKFPIGFSANEDFVYTLCAFGAFGPRMREALGLKPQSETLNIAWHRWLQEMSRSFRSPEGHVYDFPENFEDMRKFAEEWEARDWPQTDTGRELMQGMIQQLCDRFFPKPLHWFGRNLVLVLTPENIRRTQRMGDPGKVAGPVVRVVFRTMMKLKENVAPDPKVPFSEFVMTVENKANGEKRKKKMNRLYQKRMQKLGVTGDISMCPVPHAQRNSGLGE